MDFVAKMGWDIYIYRIMSVTKVETDISTSIAASLTGQAVD